MSRIGIIDDNHDQRETLRRALEVYLEDQESNLQVLDIFPFDTETFEEYYTWIEEEEIVSLIFDEKMHNETEDGVGPVNYRGNELVTIIRERFKDIPIYVITSFKTDNELEEKFSEFEDIIGREEFIDNGKKYVNRIIRASQRYLDENSDELQQYQELSRIVASGNNSEEQLKKLRALQIKLNLPLDSNLGERRDWLDEYEQSIKELEEFKRTLQSKLDKN